MKWLALLLLLAGCAPNSGLLSPHTRTSDSATDVRVHRVASVQGVCMRLVGGFDLYLGCYWKSGDNCDIFVSEHSPEWILAHERKHCEGFAH